MFPFTSERPIMPSRRVRHPLPPTGSLSGTVNPPAHAFPGVVGNPANIGQQAHTSAEISAPMVSIPEYRLKQLEQNVHPKQMVLQVIETFYADGTSVKEQRRGI